MKENLNLIIEKEKVYYYLNGDREMGDNAHDKKIGKHVTLFTNGEIKINDYN